MSKTRSIAAVATLLLAGLPMIALATSANAQPAVIKVADLNLASPTGQKIFAQRAQDAARTVCRVTPGTRAPNRACQAAVVAEAQEKAAAITPSMMAAR